MTWFKTIVLLTVLGMTWAKCDRGPGTHSRVVPDATLNAAPTNAAGTPVAFGIRTGLNTGAGPSYRMARMAEQGR